MIMIMIMMTMGYGILRTDIPGYRVRKLMICNWTELTGYGIFGQKSNRLRLRTSLKRSFQGFSSCSYCQANRCEENHKFNASVTIRYENSDCMAL